MILYPNSSQTLILPAGQVLTLVNPSGSAGSVVRLAASPGGGDSQSTTAIAGADLTFGPYAQAERFGVFCTAGTVTYSMATPDPALVQLDTEATASLALKISHSLATATSDFLVGNTGGATFVKKTLAETKSILGLGSAAYVATSAFDAAGVAAGLIAGPLAPASLAIAEKTPVNAVAATGTLTVTAGGTQIAADYKVMLDTKEYTFKAALTPTEGEVILGITDTLSLVNLLSAINHTGTPDTDYKCAVAHPTVTATASDALTLTVEAKAKGVSAIATTKTGAEISFGAGTLQGGVNGTVGIANELCCDASYLYLALATNTTVDANWRRFTVGSAY